MELTSVKTIKYIKDKYGFNMSKGLGQNFLLDKNVLLNICKAAELDSESGAIEIGPGIGVLTNELANFSKKVVSIELDNRLKDILDETLENHTNINIIFSDILKTDLNKVIEENFSDCKKVSLAANLPYYITTPILTSILENPTLGIDNIVVMVQKEVAERICAAPGNKNCSAFSVLVHYYSNPELIEIVPAKSFMPAPKVDSAVVKLKLLSKPKVSPKSEKLFFSTVKAAFGQRRKTLLNALSGSGAFQLSKEEFKEIFKNIGFSENIRGEQLTIEDFCKLADFIYNITL